MKQEMVPRGLGIENKQDERSHKLMVRELSDILKADNRVFKPEISEFYSKIGFSGGKRSRSYIGVTFEGMLLAKDIDLVKPILEANGYKFTNIVPSFWNYKEHERQFDGLIIRFHKDIKHGEDNFP